MLIFPVLSDVSVNKEYSQPCTEIFLYISVTHLYVTYLNLKFNNRPFENGYH